MQKEVYFVTGAAGFVGRHVCQRLRGKNLEVRALVRRPDPWLTRLGVKVHVGDLNDCGTWASVLDGVSYVIHCAGDPTFGNGPQYFAANVDLTKNLLAALQENANSLLRLVFISTIGVVDRRRTDSCARPIDESSRLVPSSDYGRSKLEAEELVRASGFSFSVVRPAMVIGNDMRHNSHFAVFARHAINGSLFGRIRWPGRLSVVDVDDLAEAIILCATHPQADGETFLCGGEPVSIGEFFEFCRPNVLRVPLKWASGLARMFGVVIPFAIKILVLPALVANDSALRRLGWKPRPEWREAMAELVARERARLDPQADPGGQTVVTGAASGLGLALIELLADKRKQLLLIDKDADGLEDIRKRYQNCRVLEADLTDEAGLSAIAGSAQWQQYTITELFACAGVGIRGNVSDLPLSRQLDVFKVNLLARLGLAYEAIQGMMRHHLGRVVFISSSSAFQALPCMSVYSASNAGILFLGEGWAAEVEDRGVHILTVCPGGMQTAFQQTAGVKELAGEKLMAPHTVAKSILQALSSNKFSLIVSFRAVAMSLLARVLPRSVSVRLWKNLMTKMR